jgi:hypothetical protein
MSIGSVTIPLAARLSDIGQSLSSGSKAARNSPRRQMIGFSSSAASVWVVLHRTSKELMYSTLVISSLLQKVAGSRELFN